MSQLIHPSAVIDPKAVLDPTVEVGPFSVIEAGVTIGAGTKLGPYVHIQGVTEIGRNNMIGTGCTIGHAPQHGGYKGAPTRLVIGDNNVFREYVSVHRAYVETDATVVGNNCYIMATAHIAHDCKVGNHVTMANTAALAGHAIVGDRTFISGFAGVHQFCKVGRLVMVGGVCKVSQDVPPFVMVDGAPGRIRGLNKVGLQRSGVSEASIEELENLLKALYREGGDTRKAAAEMDGSGLGAEARELLEFFTNESKRGILPFFGTAQRDRLAV